VAGNYIDYARPGENSLRKEKRQASRAITFTQ